MPWVVKFVFDEETCVDIQKYNLFGCQRDVPFVMVGRI